MIDTPDTPFLFWSLRLRDYILQYFQGFEEPSK